MSSISESITKYNTKAGHAILQKYGSQPAMDARDMVFKLDTIGKNFANSYMDFAEAHPDYDFITNAMSTSKISDTSYSNCSGDEKCAKCKPKSDNDGGSTNAFKEFYQKNSNVIIIGLALIVVAVIVKK